MVDVCGSRRRAQPDRPTRRALNGADGISRQPGRAHSVRLRWLRPATPDHALYKDPDLDEAEARETSLSGESGENGKERASRNPKVFAPCSTLIFCGSVSVNFLARFGAPIASSRRSLSSTLALGFGRRETGIYVINYLASRGPELQNFVVGSLIQLLCRITKFGWFDDDRFREVVNEATNFLSQASSGHYSIGLKMLNQLVSEMSQPNQGMSLTNHRKVACSFRDQSLFQIFQISLTSLHQLKSDEDMQAVSVLRELALSLSLKCLSFDFVGTSVDESSEEFGTVQIPSSWKPVIQDPSTLQIFFDYYSITEPPLSKEALECLVRLASVRRSLFTDDPARSQFLAHLMRGTKEILQIGQGLADHDNYHEFCRLLGRFKVNFQLSELLSVEIYTDWIHLVAEFTTKSLQSWQWASNSVYYLLGLWSRLVTSVPYLKGDTPSLLDETVPKITEGFITSRFSSVQGGFSDDLSDNPLDNIELLQDQLECFPYLCRFQYGSSSVYIIKIMEPILQAYTERARLPTHGDVDELSVIEGQIAWIVHIIAAILKVRQTTCCSTESQELIDAELAARVLQLINITDSGLHSQQLYTRLSELLGIHDHLVLLNIIVGKIATNLKCYTECEEVIEHTLSLFLELASGYMTGKLLLKLDSIKFIISHHTRENFPFLEDNRCSHSRTTFYYTLGYLIFMEDSPVKFKSSMEPLLQVMIGLKTTPDAAFRSDAVKYAFIGLMRDLRGIAMATNSRRTYGLLFDWLYPAHMPLLLKAISHWADVPQVTTPLLKFMAEFVLNKAQRLTFDSSSANGILLFREVSKLVVAYGSRILSHPISTDVYANKYKGIWISLTILTRAMTGNYVNFGVFELYGDRALADVLDISLKMILSISLSDILAYQKWAQAKVVMVFIPVRLDWHAFFEVEDMVCASAIDNLASFYFNNITVGEMPPSPATMNLARHVAECPNLFAEILKTLFEIVLFEDCGNQWSLSRPMLSLILISEQVFNDLKVQILASQPSDQVERLSQCFDKLMADVTRSLESKNRDKFTQNLTLFRHEFRVK
ncbi:hypothetical protein MUK42_19697 [Musa troglodytarum]|uniref:Exportin-7/Ran-binding protein 17 TPR repeats domain-containing protein n=1 Tax=Musa troglodytarum TaxID=320322 RepID=A0A9E7K786_9LILI|nr:hypothetical protein MUK42_19697 [Musa troglodytarum]